MKCAVTSCTNAAMNHLDSDFCSNHTREAYVTKGSFRTRGERIGALVDEKNAAYGDSFQRSGEVMKLLYPDGIKPEQYVDALGIVRVVDKLFRIAHRKDAFGENPWDDICGYGVVAGGKESLK